MKTEEINRVNRNLARFAGYSETFIAWYDKPEGTRPSYIVDYTKDLNALVPIWEKLSTTYNLRTHYEFQCGHRVKFRVGTFPWEFAETIQQALALATEKAILALEGGK